ncbi:cytochrome P450 [Jimgerdemannia flammicorona]|uniref:Cytochrome P450 n=1 Tax=Jimgerdemannia flammicorona TaxID=994334 RepID=A0A433B924_9FUNG|nr:cytochrome P450 [Jimgerdemannia flammicorona]
MSLQLQTAAVVIDVAAALLRLHQNRVTEGNLPLSPAGPVVGHRSLYSIRMGSKDVVIVHYPEMVKQLLDVHSTVTSSRYYSLILNEHVTKDTFFGQMSYGANWRRLRKFAHAVMTSDMANRYQPIINVKANTLISSLLTEILANSTGVDVLKYTARFALNLYLRVAFGTQIQSLDDPFLKENIEVMELLGHVFDTPANLGDFFPALHWLESVEKGIDVECLAKPRPEQFRR